MRNALRDTGHVCLPKGAGDSGLSTNLETILQVTRGKWELVLFKVPRIGESSVPWIVFNMSMSTKLRSTV